MERGAHAAGDANPADFAGLRVAVSGGASLSGEIARAFEARFGCTILEGQGLTETTAFGTFDDIDRGGKTGYSGRAVLRLQVRVRDDGRQEVPAGYRRRGPHQGTHSDARLLEPPRGHRRGHLDGRFRTGDLGETDTDGDLRIVDRIKDLIIRVTTSTSARSGKFCTSSRTSSRQP
ncbi:AMP-binding protein [Streptomyces aurantiogriseus]|uniref:AMP-dependent synthetase/ligase domain-containing protein n=1 Tax=Streptomyces aurantiogriseus TaxID=66870 RepID=A0A918KZ01_9ACTN|nr:hypothetical protein GCM10010251_82290 [Streptomyces aurantiogriseus]